MKVDDIKVGITYLHSQHPNYVYRGYYKDGERFLLVVEGPTCVGERVIVQVNDSINDLFWDQFYVAPSMDREVMFEESEG